MDMLWIILLVGFLVLEAATTQFICIWFAGGSLAAFICSLCGLNITAQTTVFVIASLLLLISTRKLVNKLKSKTEIKTNADALIGKSAVVLEEISNIDSKGCVKIGGIEWSARSADGEVIPANSYVTVKDIEGVKLIVDKITQ